MMPGNTRQSGEDEIVVYFSALTRVDEECAANRKPTAAGGAPACIV